MNTKEDEASLTDRMLTRKEVGRLVGVSENTLNRLIQEGSLPHPIELGPRCLRWLESEIQAAVRAMPRR